MIGTGPVRLADYTTLRLGGPAARFVEATSDEQVVAEVRTADRTGEPVLVLGGGSNLVVADDGFAGTVLRMATRGVGVAADGAAVLLTVAAGEDWDALVQRCVLDGLSGVECLSGIPGLTGATPIQNVGAYGQEVAQTIVSVRAYDRLRDRVISLSPADCEFGYRTSVFKRRSSTGGVQGGRPPRAVLPSRGGALNPASATGRFVVLGVQFRLAADPLSAPVRYGELSRVLGVPEDGRVPLAAAREAVLGLRRGKGMVLDPADPDTSSAGSFFTNPVLTAGQFSELAACAAGLDLGTVPNWAGEDNTVKVSAAWLIERAGFGKGYRGSGGARISTKHTLALTNTGHASTADLIGLAREVVAGVRKTFGVDLVNEPVLVGVEL